MLEKLPKRVRLEAREAYKLFNQNQRHRSLRFKKVHNIEPIYSARINIDYRAVGIVDDGEIIWFWIGPHSEYERLLNRL